MIGLASERNHQWLIAHGVVPVTYGEGVADRIRAAAAKVDAFIDTVGGYVELALELGVDPGRIDTIADFQARKREDGASRPTEPPPVSRAPATCSPSWRRS